MTEAEQHDAVDRLRILDPDSPYLEIIDRLTDDKGRLHAERRELKRAIEALRDGEKHHEETLRRAVADARREGYQKAIREQEQP